uniref:Uncharacterized protein n=1 Tax=Bracon brevicornis TaxID=1563983 RepID=A0A6V7LFS2_9HYME
MSTQAYYKERLGFDPADTVAEHQRDQQRSEHGYEESLTKFKGQNGTIDCAGDEVDNTRPSSSLAYWGCWAKFIEAHGKDSC